MWSTWFLLLIAYSNYRNFITIEVKFEIDGTGMQAWFLHADTNVRIQAQQNKKKKKTTAMRKNGFAFGMTFTLPKKEAVNLTICV